jgi:hypothetical protein
VVKYRKPGSRFQVSSFMFFRTTSLRKGAEFKWDDVYILPRAGESRAHGKVYPA